MQKKHLIETRIHFIYLFFKQNDRFYLLAFTARLIYYKDNNILLNLVIIKYTIPIQDHCTYFMYQREEWSLLGCQEWK